MCRLLNGPRFADWDRSARGRRVQVVRGMRIRSQQVRFLGAHVVFGADAVGGAQVVEALECPARASPLQRANVPITDRMALHRIHCRVMVTPPEQTREHKKNAEMQQLSRHSCNANVQGYGKKCANSPIAESGHVIGPLCSRICFRSSRRLLLPGCSILRRT